MKIILGVTRAVDYIHHAEPGPAFRDIKTTHVVLDKDDNLKLIDFGTAILEHELKSCSFLKETKPHQAPEYLKRSSLATYSDI